MMPATHRMPMQPGPRARRAACTGAAWLGALLGALLWALVATAWATGEAAPAPGDPAAAMTAAGARVISPAATLSPGGMLLRVALGLALVLGLLGGVLLLYRKATRGRPSLRGDASIEILSQRALGQRTNLAVVRVAGEVLLLGVTQQQINTLARLAGLASEMQPVGSIGAAALTLPAVQNAPAVSASPQDAADVEALIASAPSGAPARDFESALEGELQRVKQGLWASLRRMEVPPK